MESARWQQLEEIFQTAAERPLAERAAYLTQACGGDHFLRQQVEALLACDVYDTFIQGPIQDAARTLAVEPERELIGQQLGPYRVTALIGQGGMGAVYAAVRADEQFEQRVAIKLVKRGMDSSFVLSRFHHERQILAALAHPNIARLLDGGATPGGRPYFVMEFIEGQTLNEYCDAEQLGINERIRLFRQVCAAVQYAHRQLVVHRDLKPGNILVTGEGVPKLLDFGLAKLLDPAQRENDPARTATLLRMMTPAYASPEQVRGAPVTTATDVYSLGAVLYELLSGQPAHRLETYTPTEIERVICDNEVERPSAAARRNTTLPARARKQLAGELDNIILLALRKEPERRYASVEQFSDDLLRYLEDRPITARGAGIGYRAGKFARRHKLGVLATVLVLVSLLGGLALANYQARRAERRFQQVRKLANTFLFDFHDDIANLPGSTKAREKVVRTALEYLNSLTGEAAGDEALQLELAQAYLKVGLVQGDTRSANLGQNADALVSYRKGLALAEPLIAGAPGNSALFEVLTKLHINLGNRLVANGDTPGGLAELRAALRVAEQINAREPDQQAHLLLLILSTEALGDAQLAQRDVMAALASFRRTLQVSEQRAARFPSAAARHSLSLTHSRVGDALAEQGDLTATVQHYRHAKQLREELVKAEPHNAIYRRELKVLYNWLGNFLGNPQFLNLGQRDEALLLYRRALELSEELAAADAQNALAQFDLVVSYDKLADLLAEPQPAQGALYYRRAFGLTGKLLAGTPNQYRWLRRQLIIQRKLGTLLWRQGDRAGALRELRPALEKLQALAAAHPTNPELPADLHAARLALAPALTETEALGQYTQARLVAEQMSAARQADLYARWRLADSYTGLGEYHAGLGEWRAALRWQQQALAVWDAWGQHAVSSVFNTTRREQAARALARTQAKLSAAE